MVIESSANEKTEIAALDESINREITALAAMLLEKKLRVTAAESLTGGMISSSFVDVPGSSDWFSYGFVTYSNEAKTEMVGVPAKLIEENTAVDAEVGLEMAKGALNRSGADAAVAVTGLAGPFSDANGVPYPMDPRHVPGLVFIACAAKNGASVRRCVFTGSRTMIRKKTVLSAVRMLKKLVQSMP